MTSLTTSVPIVIPQAAVAPWHERMRVGLARLRFWRERARQRTALADLDDHMLRDVGLTKYDVARECAKLPWQ